VGAVIDLMAVRRERAKEALKREIQEHLAEVSRFNAWIDWFMIHDERPR
jgi:hypothetical protein